MKRREDSIFKAVIILLLFFILSISLYCHKNYISNEKNGIIKKISNGMGKTVIDRYSFNKNILYVSRHDGTISNFSNIAELLSFNVTVLEPTYDFEKKPNCYDKDECRSFVNTMCSLYDYIVISDIIPDSFIYLKNQCKSKIILEITNRFDLFVDSDFKEYYEQFGKAVTEYDNVVVVENNPFEAYYACKQNVFIPNYYLIRPVGYAPPEVLTEKHDEVHEEIAIINHTNQDRKIGIKKLEELGINHKVLEHRYGGPLVLATYKAVVMLPYQVSIMKMMENFRYGVAMLLPSERLFKEELLSMDDDMYEFSAKDLKDIPNGISNYVEFYNKDFRDLFVYFDKWEDLPKIIEKTDFDALKKKVMKFIERYEQKALILWARALGILPAKDFVSNKQPLCDNTDFYNYGNQSNEENQNQKQNQDQK